MTKSRMFLKQQPHHLRKSFKFNKLVIIKIKKKNHRNFLAFQFSQTINTDKYQK
jgi:hypothetical protein